jgi:hypothetical protein
MHDFSRLLDLLVDDAKRAYEEMRAGDLPAPLTQYRRRNWVRAVFAHIEGLLFVKRQLVLLTAADQLSTAELAGLTEETSTIGDNGIPRSKPWFIPLETNLRFMFRMQAKIYGIETVIDYNSAGWAAFKKSTYIRHRITHPKSLSALNIVDDELYTVFEGHDWFTITTAATTQAMLAGRK